MAIRYVKIEDGVHCPRCGASLWTEIERLRSAMLRLAPKPRTIINGQTIEAAQPWVANGVSRRTWYRNRMLMKADPSIESVKPWVAEQVSRATWYRRQRLTEV